MSPIVVSLIAFACISTGVLTGMLFRLILPEHYLKDESKDMVKTGAGVIGTLSALVLGLLVGSSKSSFDAVNAGIKDAGAKVVALDHLLARLGPDTMAARTQLRQGLASAIKYNWPEEKTELPPTQSSPVAGSALEGVLDKTLALSPKNDAQRWLQSQALQLSSALVQSRLLVVSETQNAIPVPFLVVLIFWLTMLFLSFGLFTPRFPAIVAVLLVSALSMSGAIFLILELNNPVHGLIKASSTPLRNSLAQVSQ